MSFKPLGYILKWKIDFIEVLMKNCLYFLIDSISVPHLSEIYPPYDSNDFTGD